MLAVIIIVLREMLEIFLIVGMVSAALKEVGYRKKVISVGGGVGLGLFISICFAFVLNEINMLFDGEGQEFLNIFILSSSIFCIAWTLLWMSGYSKKLANKVHNASIKMKKEDVNIWPMILLILFAIIREGGELILFLFGLSTGGIDNYDMIIGVIVGIVIGLMFSFGVYSGLINLEIKRFFKVINCLLVLLAAGMASQLASYVSAIDLISYFSSTMWDSSRFISDGSILGKLLNGLIGYSSRPTVLQVVFYLSTILVMIFLLKVKKSRSSS